MSARDDFVAAMDWLRFGANAPMGARIPKASCKALLALLDAEPVAYFVDQGGSGEMDLGLFHLTREEAEQDCVDGDRIVPLYARPEASDAEPVARCPHGVFIETRCDDCEEASDE